MSDKRYGDGVFVRLTPEQMRFVEEMARSTGAKPPTVMRAALLYFMRRVEEE